MLIDSTNIVLDPAEVLRQKAQEVELPLSQENTELIQAMIDYVRNSHDEDFCKEHNVRASVGIAAPQVGKSLKMLAISIAYTDDEPTEFAWVNPKIISNSRQKAYLQTGESCLSVPTDIPGYVPRYNRITVRAFNYLTGQNEVVKLEGYEAIVAQHEIDHLYGHLYYDHINKEDPYAAIENSVEI